MTCRRLRRRARRSGRGWYASAAGWFKATVVKHRRAWPPLHVRFVEDEAGSSHPLALPPLDAYVHGGDVRAV